MKVIGNGAIAKSLLESLADLTSDYQIYAAGVSNSSENDPSNFERDFSRIERFLDSESTKIIYFSSQMVETVKNPYYSHKLNIEALIHSKSTESVIIRLPQLIYYKKNAPSLIPSLLDKIYHSSGRFTLKLGEKRRLISMADLVSLIRFLFTARHDHLDGPLIFSPNYAVSVETIFETCLVAKDSRNIDVTQALERIIDSAMRDVDDPIQPDEKSLYTDWFSSRVGKLTARSVLRHQLSQLYHLSQTISPDLKN